MCGKQALKEESNLLKVMRLIGSELGLDCKTHAVTIATVPAGSQGKVLGAHRWQKSCDEHNARTLDPTLSSSTRLEAGPPLRLGWLESQTSHILAPTGRCGWRSKAETSRKPGCPVQLKKAEVSLELKNLWSNIPRQAKFCSMG